MTTMMSRFAAVALVLILGTGDAIARVAAVQPAPFVTDEVLQGFAELPEGNGVVDSAQKGLRKIQKGDYKGANKAFAAGLRLDAKNGSLHFLNGLAYHLRSLEGDSSLLEKAETGYAVALRYDSTNHHAAYLLGHVYFAQRRFVEAQDQFAYGLLYAPNDANLLRALTTTAYYTRELDVAQWAAKKAKALDPQNPKSWRAALFSEAASGDLASAQKDLAEYKARAPKHFSRVSSRVNDWKTFHLAQFSTDEKAEGSVVDMGDAGADDYDASQSDQADALMKTPVKGVENWKKASPDAMPPVATPATATPAKPKVKLPRMTLVDVVILRTEESRSQSKGVNLLTGLQATLTGTLFAYNRVNGYTSGGTDADSETTTVAPTLALSGLQYNLDIFNDSKSKAEVLARPSLLGVENTPAKFFSGSTLHVQLNSNNADGSLVDVPVGIHLNVTPTFLDEETVKVQVHAERNFIETNDSKLGFTVFSQTSKTSVDATAAMRFGDTMILSGLSENENTNSRTGVPFLGRIPVLQYLFSRKVESQTKKSILILLSPHKARLAGDGLKPGKDLGAHLQRGKHLRALRKKENIVATENIDAAFAHLAHSNFYRQFRSGDLRLDIWHQQDNLLGALKRALGFLYY